MSNRQLLEMYESQWHRMNEVSSRCNEEMSGPFLAAPREAYWSAKRKAVFVGQETNGWSSEDDAAAQMETYERFNLGEAYYSSPFWNVIRKFEAALVGSTYSSVWLNLNRFDENDGSTSGANRLILSELDFLLKSELQILGPDIVIFFTGPDYDERLENLLGASVCQVGSFPLRQLCRFTTPGSKAIMFRTYHPKYLRLSKLEESVIDSVCAEALVGSV